MGAYRWVHWWSQRDHGLLAPLGPVYQAGTLSGNPLAMAAGIAALKKLANEQPYAQLETMGQLIRQHLMTIANEKGLPLQVPQVGSMFALFFSEQVVQNYQDATASETAHFAKLFKNALNWVFIFRHQSRNLLYQYRPQGQDIEQAAELIGQALQAL